MKFFIWLLILFPLKSFTQDQVYKNYTVEDGLPSSEVYFSFQDSKGYMWFATDAGVSKFNGYEFENFTTEDGLTDNTVFRITEDSKGRIWFAPFNGRFCYYKDSIFSEPLYLKESQNKIGDLTNLQSFYFDSMDCLWIGQTYEGIHRVSPNGEVQQMIKLDKDESLKTEAIKVENIMISGSLISEKGRVSLMSSHKTSISFYNDTIIYEPRPSENNASRGIYRVDANKEYLGYFKGVNLFILNKFGEQNKINIPELEHHSGIYISIKSSKIYVGLENKGIFIYELINENWKLTNRKLKDKSISSVNIDNTQGIWYTSLSNGVYYLPSEATKDLVLPDENIYDLEVDQINNKLFVSLRNGSLIEVSETIKILEKLTRNHLSIYFNPEEEALFWGRSDGNKFIKYKNGVIVKTLKFNWSPNFKSMIMKDNKVYYVNDMGLNIVSDTSWFSTYINEKSSLWCTSIAFNLNKIWVGTNEGLKVLDKGVLKDTFGESKKKKYSITSLLSLNDSLLVVGTKSKGLLLFDNGQIKEIININKGLASNLVRAIHKDNDGVVWCGTNKGLSRVERIEDLDYSIYNFTKKNGLISEEIRSLKSNKDTLYLGTEKGVFVLDKTKIKTNKLAPVLSILNYTVNSETKTSDEILKLRYDENNLSINYLGINYRSLGKVNYKYRLIGSGTDTNWVSAQSRVVQYTLLPSSEYVFEVKAENEDGVWSEVKQLHFVIYPPFWKTWWFRIIGLIGLSLFIYWIVSLSFKRREKALLEKQKKADVEKKLVELELKALRSQMNPHFIFNILNSIQHFMLQNNFKDTNHYLTQFAKLIRTVLNLSEKQFITIDEELDMLKLYMNLEKMRFENGFDYQIIIDESIDVDYDEIPSMLIQPYIENAIWHGLMNKNSKGIIKIRIYLKDNYLFCIIEDNGIGINEAKKIKAKRKNLKHKSVGMRITKDRLNLINEYDGVSVDIKDLSEITPNNNGTRVKIQIKI